MGELVVDYLAGVDFTLVALKENQTGKGGMLVE